MCTSRPKPPPVIDRDPVKEAADAERLANEEANITLADRRKRLRASMLSTMGGRGVTQRAPSALAQAMPKP